MSRRLTLALAASIAVLAAACTGSGASSGPSGEVLGETDAPAQSTEAMPSAAASDAGSAAPGSSGGTGSGGSSFTTLLATEVGDAGTILVSGLNGMTVYIFTQDEKDSGVSNCAAECLEKWPPVTVTEGSTPSVGPGISGEVGTITREDTGELQVTYNGMPLYYYAEDEGPLSLNGVYENWETVTP